MVDGTTKGGTTGRVFCYRTSPVQSAKFLHVIDSGSAGTQRASYHSIGAAIDCALSQ